MFVWRLIFAFIYFYYLATEAWSALTNSCVDKCKSQSLTVELAIEIVLKHKALCVCSVWFYMKQTVDK